MRFKQVGNKRDQLLIVVKNGESTATLQQGQMLAYNLSNVAQGSNPGQDDGLQVVNPSTAGIPSYALMAGILETPSVAPGGIGEAIVFGFVQSAKLTIGTRSATSASWGSSASLASGALLAIDTANNCLLTFSSAAPQSHFQPFAILVDNIATQAGSATTTSDTRTAITANHRVFVAMM